MTIFLKCFDPLQTIFSTRSLINFLKLNMLWINFYLKLAMCYVLFWGLFIPSILDYKPNSLTFVRSISMHGFFKTKISSIPNKLTHSLQIIEFFLSSTTHFIGMWINHYLLQITHMLSPVLFLPWSLFLIFILNTCFICKSSLFLDILH